MDNNNFNDLLTSMSQVIEFLDGDITKATLKSVELKPVKKYLPSEIKNIRKMNNLTQATMAHIMGISKRTLEDWEAGKNTPNGPSSRILDMLSKAETADIYKNAFIQHN